jgi:glycosyltransferase involved in cell wall biosynthesis
VKRSFLINRSAERDSDRIVEGYSRARILQIGNYPPPVCGWAMQTKLLVEEIRRRGNVCQVLNLNESRKRRSREYIDVQNVFDYLRKLIQFALRGYRFQVHVNGQSTPGYILAFIAAVVGRLAGHPVALSWRGGLQQRYFPRPEGLSVRWAFRLLFRLAGQISCNNMAVKHAIEQYGIEAARIAVIPGFSKQNVEFQRVPLAEEIETFLASHHPVFFCYVSFRPEYRLPVLREAMLQFRQQHPEAGFIWLGFPSKELPAVNEFVADWPERERQSLLLLGNLAHNEFLTLLTRCFAYIRTPACDGVAASVLESLALGIPVVASENGHRPANVTTYREGDASDLCTKLIRATEGYDEVKKQTHLEVSEDNISRTVDWLLGAPARKPEELKRDWVHVA